MAESEVSMTPGVAEYQPPDVVDLRVSVPRGLLPSPVQEAKWHRHLRRAFLTTIAGLAVTATSGGVAYLLTGRPVRGSSWLAVLAVLALSRGLVQWRTYRGEISRSLGLVDEILAALRIATLGSLIGAVAVLTAEAVRSFRYPGGLLVTEWLLGVLLWTALLVGLKLAATHLRNEGRYTRQVLVVGNTATSRRLIEQISRHPETGYRVAGVVPFDIATGSTSNPRK